MAAEWEKKKVEITVADGKKRKERFWPQDEKKRK